MTAFDFEPYVIAVSGPVGSGKSTVTARLSKLLGGAPALVFDDYELHARWPPDIDKWIKEGADPNQVSVPKLREDLLSLLRGEAILHPVDNKVVSPSEYIIVEEPSGRERREIGEYIDLLVFIDVPQDLCVARIIQRAIDMDVWQEKRTFENESKEDLVRQMNSVASWLSHYTRVRSMYIGISNVVKQNADIVVNGLKPAAEIAEEIRRAIESLNGRH